MDVIPKSKQKTLYVVRAGESDDSPVVYRGNSDQEARSVANAYPNSTTTFKEPLRWPRVMGVGRSD